MLGGFCGTQEVGATKKDRIEGDIGREVCLGDE
jgi:hypothetical protein